MEDRPDLPENTAQAKPEINMADIPPADTRETLRTFVPVMIIEVVMSAIMVGVYIALGRFSSKVLFGALLGTVAELVNFTIMVLSLLKAERASTAARGQLNARGNYVIRMIVLIVILVVALKSGLFEPLATILPLCFMRIAIFVSDIIFKAYDNKNKKEERS